MLSLYLLRHVQVFKNLDETHLIKLRPFCEELEFRSETKLFTEGDPAEHLWCIVEGHVDLRFEMPDGRSTSTKHTVSSVEVKDKASESMILGWSCFVPPYKMRLSAYCVTDPVKIIRVSKQDLFRLFEEDSRMGYLFMSYMIKVVGYRFHQFQDYVAKHMGESLISGW
jgi:CRP-like cAMP-binding protein